MLSILQGFVITGIRHGFAEKAKHAEKTFKFMGLQAVLIALFVCTFELFARYFDFFWELLPRSLFFMLGGLVLLVISVVLERKRRELKVQFSGGEQ